MKTISTRELLAATTNIPVAGVSDEKPCCSVKEAAARIERSASTVYRLRRKPGPIRFVVEGRRIYVETDSLDQYLARRGSNEAVCNTRPTALASTRLKAEIPTGAGNVCEGPTAQAEHIQAHPSQPETSCGQRDLSIAPARSCFVVFYTF
jgi:hypothetical protein